MRYVMILCLVMAACGSDDTEALSDDERFEQDCFSLDKVMLELILVEGGEECAPTGDIDVECEDFSEPVQYDFDDCAVTRKTVDGCELYIYVDFVGFEKDTCAWEADW